jgi:hypothetical protein
MSASTNRRVKSWAVTVGTTATTAALAAAAMAAVSDGNSEGNGSTPTSSATEAMISGPSADQTSSFQVLRQAQRPDDDPGTSKEGPFGANLSLARKVNSAAGTLWVVPANDHVCLRVATKVSTMWACTTTAEAKVGRLVLASERRTSAKLGLSMLSFLTEPARSRHACRATRVPR